jgi:hypothetical protein
MNPQAALRGQQPQSAESMMQAARAIVARSSEKLLEVDLEEAAAIQARFSRPHPVASLAFRTQPECIASMPRRPVIDALFRVWVSKNLNPETQIAPTGRSLTHGVVRNPRHVVRCN